MADDVSSAVYLQIELSTPSFMLIGLGMPFWPRELRAEGQRSHILWSCMVCVVGSEGVVLLVIQGAMQGWTGVTSKLCIYKGDTLMAWDRVRK